MRERIRYELVIFNRPFVVTAIDRIQAAGLYQLETIEASVEGFSFAAYRVVSTSIMLPLGSVAPKAFQLVPIDAEVVRTAQLLATGATRYGRPSEV